MIEALKTLNRLKKNGLVRDYAICGGYAVNYYVEPILTYDLDIFVLMNTDEDFHVLYEYFRKARYKIENVYVMIKGTPVQFLPSYIDPLIDEAIRKAKRIGAKGVRSKVVTVEYLIATLLMAFRPKDRMIIPELLELADKGRLESIIGRFSSERYALDKRLKRILASIR